MYILKISGVELPAPDSYDVEMSDLDSPNTGRSETGVLSRQRVRADVAKIGAAWRMLTTGELEQITGAIAGESFPVSFFYGGYREAQMYCGNRKIKLVVTDQEKNARWDISVSLVEY